MSQITLYLDDATQTLVDQAVKPHEWPQDCLTLAGRFPDFPLRPEAQNSPVADVPGLQWVNWNTQNA